MGHVRVRFVNADPRHASPDSFFVRMTEAATQRPVRIVSSPSQKCDIEFASVQYPVFSRIVRAGMRQWHRALPARLTARDGRWLEHNPVPTGTARAHIWFTGENVRPPVGDWSGYLSFDLDPLDGRNAYCPLWWWGIGLMGRPHSPFIDPAPDLQSLMRPRNPDSARRGFVVAFINNPHPMRLHAIKALQEYGPVEVYGRAVGRPVASKASIARNFRFMLCFENDVYPGYVTEKAIEAWSCGAVPLWWGDDAAGYLNGSAMLNAAQFPSIAAFAEETARVFRDEEAWRGVAAKPIVRRTPDLSAPLRLISQAAGSS